MRRTWTPLLIVGGLLLLLTYLFAHSRTLDAEVRARMHEALQAFALHDAELTRDVLQARAGLLTNYDSLARTGRSLRDGVEVLRAESATAAGPAGRDIARHVEDLAGALAQKLALVEYFKSDNALLRNSSAYFTYAGQALRARAAAEAPVADEIGALSQAMLRFMQAPEPATAREAEEALRRASARPRFQQHELRTLLTHGELIVQVQPQVDALLQDIIATPTAARADALQEAVLRYASQVEARAQLFRLLLYLVAVVLLGYVLYQFLRLRATARDLRRANTDLEREMAERQEAVTALRSSEERFRAITESANDAIISADSAGRIVSWNAQAEALFGYATGEALGHALTRMIAAADGLIQGTAAAQPPAGGPPAHGRTIEVSGRRKDGSEFPAEISLSTWSTAQDRYVTATVRDLTARKRLEETTRQQELQLIQANKMTALGTLVSGVAHEINNPNQLVLANARVLADAWDDALPLLDLHRLESGEFSLSGLGYAEMRKTIPALNRDVHAAAVRIDKIINELKDFARPRREGIAGLFDVNDAVQRAVRLLAHLIRRRTDRFRVDLAPALPALRGDAQQVEQVVVNLVINALEALPDRERAVTVLTSFDPSTSAVALEVRDEGVGIPPDHLARLCEPFFTTRQSSGGTGLGLAITASLVRAHGGALAFTTEPGRGTCARVTLPVPSSRPESDRP